MLLPNSRARWSDRAGQRHNFDSTQAAQILRVYLSHETGSDESRLQHLHNVIGWALTICWEWELVN